MGWTVEAEDRIFDKKTIFDYIDGAGEMYLSYNMKNCLSRRFRSKNGPAIMLDIFDMGSSEDAFGVFTYEQDGESLDIGQGALYRPGWLNFWKDRFSISIYAEEETPDAEKAVRELGKAIAERITRVGPKPDILLRLPKEGLEPNSIRYFHDNEMLDYHYYLSDENILNLGTETKAALADYRMGEEEARLRLGNMIRAPFKFTASPPWYRHRHRCCRQSRTVPAAAGLPPPPCGPCRPAAAAIAASPPTPS